MKRLGLAVLLLLLPCDAQLLTNPSHRTVPVTDNSGLMMDIYRQTNAQNAQLTALVAQVSDVKETVTRIETAQQDSEKSMDSMRHDIDRQGVIASFFVYSAQTLLTILVAVFVTVPGTFLVQRFLNERLARKPTAPEEPV